MRVGAQARELDPRPGAELAAIESAIGVLERLVGKRKG